MTSLLEIKGLTKRFGPVPAVDEISFNVDRGEVLGFLGPNGAGKTTTMRMMTGFIEPTSGSAKVCGFDVVSQPVEVKKRVGYLPEGAPAYGDMTPFGFLNFIANLRGLRGAQKRQRIEAAVDRLQLGSVLYQPIETLSKGYRRRVGLAQAILLDPEVLILDEPTDGLDPNQKHQVRELLREIAGEKAIIVSTHILEEVEAVCSRAIIIDKGRIVADASPHDLLSQSRQHNAVSVRIPFEDLVTAKEFLSRVPWVREVEPVDTANGIGQLRVLPSNGKDILPEIHRSVEKQGIPVSEIYREQGSLDDVFRKLTTTV